MDEATDVAILGGAVVGSAVAWHLSCVQRHPGRIVVIEHDPSYARSATALSVSSIRQQFSCPVNVRVSQQSLGFIRSAAEKFGADFGWREAGYLFLASPQGRAVLEANHKTQTALGADVLWHEPEALAARFPYLSTEGLAAGTWGQTGEGWFDGYGLMQAMRAQARAQGVTWMTAQASAIETISGAATAVRLEDGTRIAARHVVLSAGTGSRALAASAGIDLPVHARKRMVFTFRAEDRVAPVPLTIDPSGIYWRPEGDGFLCGLSPGPEEDPDAGDDFEVDWSWFEQRIWPTMAARVPAFERIKPGRAWAGHYDLNLFDHNALVGAWPGCPNLHVACGFSGHGMQQSFTVGACLAASIAGAPAPLDISDLSPARLLRGEKLLELNIV